MKSLAGVCVSEGLPEPQPLSPGEQRTVATAACGAFVAESPPCRWCREGRSSRPFDMGKERF